MTGDDARPDILVSHPGNPRVYDMVVALARAGFRLHFATGYYFDRNGPETRLPAAAKRRLARRLHPGIDPAWVSRSLVGEALARGLDRLDREHRAANGWLDRRGARLVRRLRPRLVLAADTCALHAFRAAAEIGAARVLDQVIGFEGAGARVMQDEARRQPGLAAGMLWPSETTVARCRAEVLAADRILAPSGYVRDTLIEAGADPARIAMLPYGVDIDRFRPAPRTADGTYRVLFVGQIGARKGVPDLLQAFRAAAIPRSELVLAGAIAGDGGWLAPFRGLYRHVPHVPHGEAHRLFAEADAFVFPSLHEGMALSVLEAMASGLPVVTTRNAGAPVVDGEDGFVVPIRDPAALADRMRVLHADPALRARMGQSARRRAENYDLARYERGLAEALRPLLPPKP